MKLPNFIWVTYSFSLIKLIINFELPNFIWNIALRYQEHLSKHVYVELLINNFFSYYIQFANFFYFSYQFFYSYLPTFKIYQLFLEIIDLPVKMITTFLD